MAWRLSNHLNLVQFRRRLAHVDALPQLSVLGLASGVLTGLVMVAFRVALEEPLAYLLPGGEQETFESLPPAWRFALPVAGGLLVGLLLERLPALRRQVGVVHVMERLSRHQGHLPATNAWVQFVGGIAALASGQSGGREGPAVHLGAAISSLLGQRLRLPNNSIRTLVGCGVAAAIAASFNTPIAGVIFAMEVVMMEYTVISFIPVILAAVTATLISVLFFGNAPAFAVPALQLQSLWNVPFVIALGTVLGVLAAAFVFVTERCARLQRPPVWCRLTIAGACTGAVAVFVPMVLGVGYDSVGAALLGEIGLTALVVGALTKLLLSAVTMGMGMPTGVIGPSLFVGAMAGGAMGIGGAMVWPEQATSPEVYVVLGMGAMMGAVLQAPLAALMAILELTMNPNIILPAMLAIVVASMVSSEIFGRKSIFVTLLKARGLRFTSDPVTLALQRAGVVSRMDRRLVRLRRRLSAEEARRALDDAPRWIVIEEEERGPIAVLAASDLARHLESPPAERVAGGGDEVPEDAHPSPRRPRAEAEAVAKTAPQEQRLDLLAIPGMRKDVILVPSQATLHEALERLRESGKEAALVTRPAAPMITSVIGVLTREDIESFYGYRG